ncbi:MAG: polysulfide reductase NrfD [Mariniblastus sp.]|nr:polysulfide reductase NrfD [Mariniblastus sp.]
MANFGFIIDNRRCIGCHACTVACKSEHDVAVGVNRTWVKYIEKGEFPHSKRLFSVMRCNHCDNAPCVEICPVTALYRRPDGIVDFDNRRCIGCKACMQACPYDALYIDPKTHTAAKCNYCAHRIDKGLEPACVNVCPTQAIVSGDLDDPDSKISRLRNRQPVTARKTEKGTLPSLFYIEADADSLDPVATEVAESSMWGSQSSGVGHYAEHSRHALDRLGDLLSLGERSEMISPEPADQGQAAGRAVDIVEAARAQPRRAYDAPQKGVLWGWQVSGYLWTKSIAAGVVMVPLLAHLLKQVNVSPAIELTGLVIAFLFMALTGGLLVWDLDRPKRFLYVLLRPQWKSWLVRGAYIITAFMAVLTIYTVMVWAGRAFILEPLVQGVLFLLAAMTASYTAFLFAQAKGRDFWQSPMLPVHMLNHALIAGASTLALFARLGGESWQAYLQVVLIVTLLVNLLSSGFELLVSHPTTDSGRVAKSILRGRYRVVFWGGVIGLGTLAPLALLTGAPAAGLPVAGLLAIIGVFLAQHISVRAPQQVPLS